MNINHNSTNFTCAKTLVLRSNFWRDVKKNKMPIDQEINKVLKEMWRLNENLSNGMSLTQSEIIFYNSHLKDIREYYSKNNDYWDMAVEVVTPKRICDKCGGKIRRTHVSSCPTDGRTYCEQCIDPEGKIYNDKFFGKTDR